MSKFKKILAGMLTGVSALACVAMVGNVNAAAGDIVVQKFVDVGWDKNSTSIADGWSFSKTSDVSSFTVDGIAYSITKFTTGEKLMSPKLADEAIASKADICITVGTTGSSKALELKVNALSSGAVVATGSMYTPINKALGPATTTASGSITTLTLEAQAFDSIEVVAVGKQFNISQMTVSYTLTELSEEDIEAGKIKIAEDAITAIGAVSYSKTSADKIASAKTAIEAVADASSISNYSVYTSAVESYNTLKTAAVNEFVSSVSELSTTLTKENLDSAFSKYDLILAEDKSSVATEYNSLIAYSDSYMSENAALLDKSFNVGDLTSGSTYGYRQLGNSIFTAISNSTTEVLTVGDHNKKIDGVNYTKRLYTNGVSTINADTITKAIRVNAPSAGTLKIVAVGQNNEDATRKIELYNSAFEKLLTTKAVKVDGVTTGCTVEIQLSSAGVYYLGTTNGISFYNFEFVPAKLNAQFDSDAEKNAVRFIGTIVAEDLTKVTDIKITLTLSGNDTPAVVDFTTVYTSVSHLTGFGEAENTYYIILKLTNLAAYRKSTLNATLSFMIDGVEHSASLAEALSLAV